MDAARVVSAKLPVIRWLCRHPYAECLGKKNSSTTSVIHDVSFSRSSHNRPNASSAVSPSATSSSNTVLRACQ